MKNSFYELRTISKIKHSLSYHNLEIVIHAFITSRLEYSNSLYLGLPQSFISRLQIVKNAAARLLTGSKKWEHITPVLASLHWLPVQQRIIFKTVLMVFKAINGKAPSYISDLLHPHSATRSLIMLLLFCLHVCLLNALCTALWSAQTVINVLL